MKKYLLAIALALPITLLLGSIMHIAYGNNALIIVDILSFLCGIGLYFIGKIAAVKILKVKKPDTSDKSDDVRKPLFDDAYDAISTIDAYVENAFAHNKLTSDEYTKIKEAIIWLNLII